MKHTLLLLIFVLSANLSLGQVWQVLGADPSGDDEGAGPDIDSMYVAIDVGQDSIWFKLTTHSPIADFGYYIFIDSDLIPLNGYVCEEIWGGAGSGYSSPNVSMEMDQRFVFIARSGSVDQSWTEFWGPGGGGMSTAAAFYTPDASTMIVGGKLSDVDSLVDDAHFNVIVAGGEPFFGMGSDYIPDGGYFEVFNTAGTFDVHQIQLAIAPNPTTGLVTLSGNALDLTRIKVYSVTGEIQNVPMSAENGSLVLDLSMIPSQILIVECEESNGVVSRLRIVKN